MTDTPVKGPASHFPSIERGHGRLQPRQAAETARRLPTGGMAGARHRARTCRPHKRWPGKSDQPPERFGGLLVLTS